MAEYTNLTSLEGLQVGDVITYTQNTVINFNGYKVKVELYGKMSSTKGTATNIYYANGGKTIFDFKPKKENFLFSTNAGVCLIYGNEENIYNRIAVAGNAGYGGLYENNVSGKGGLGGGAIGGNGTTIIYGLGGTQTSGGLTYVSKSQSTSTSYQGTFGYGGEGAKRSTYTPASGGNGGDGWYGGGGGYRQSSGSVHEGGGGGGGSGFIIGVSTTEYPDTYLGNDTSLQSSLASCISNGELIQGGSDISTGKMVITILEDGAETISQSILQYFNGTEFINTTASYYNGSSFIDCDVYRYDGTEFKKV